MKPPRTRIVIPIIAAVCCSVIGCSGDAFITSRSDVDRANDLLADGHYDRALKAYDALHSTHPKVAFNRGLALFSLERFDDAITAFGAVRESPDPVLKASSYFHTGNAQLRQALMAEKAGEATAATETWKEAVSAFENALALNANHEAAKRHLEIALLRAEPPCNLPDGMSSVTVAGIAMQLEDRNDELERNDDTSTARPLTMEQPTTKDAVPGERVAERQLWLCPRGTVNTSDEDWFNVTLQTGDRFLASAHHRDGPAHAKPAIEIWAPDGQRRLMPSDEEPVEELALDAVGEPGDYYVRVLNPTADDFGYTLKATIRPPCATTEDEHEPNNDRFNAKAVEGGELQSLRLCPANDDWFAVTLERGQSLKATVEATLQAGTLAVEMVDGYGNIIESSAEKEDAQQGKTVTALAYSQPAGTVYVRVTGSQDVEAVYSLQLEVIPICSEREDSHEENDEINTAQLLAPGDHEGLQLCPNDPDLYLVEVQDGESIAVHLQAEPLMGKPSVTISDGSGKPLSPGFQLKGGLLAIALDPGPGQYAVRVDAATPTDSAYDLKLQVLPACPEGNDQDEPNNNPDEATVLEPPEQQQPQAGAPGQAPPAAEPPKPKQKLLRICQGDDDWFRIPMAPETTPMKASIQFVHDKGDLDLVLYENDGETRAGESDRSDEQRNIEMLIVPPIGVRIPQQIDFFLRAHSPETEVHNFYLLSLEPMPPPNPDQQNQQQQQQQNKDQEQKEPQEEQQKDRSTLEKEMEKDDHNKRNLEAERARRMLRHNERPLKDW